MKPDQAAIDAAIAADLCLQRIDRDIATFKRKDNERRAEVMREVSEKWAAIRVIKEQHNTLVNQIRRMTSEVKRREKAQSLRRLPTKTFERRRRIRITAIIKKLEDRYIQEQRLAFRKANGVY